MFSARGFDSRHLHKNKNTRKGVFIFVEMCD